MNADLIINIALLVHLYKARADKLNPANELIQALEENSLDIIGQRDDERARLAYAHVASL